MHFIFFCHVGWKEEELYQKLANKQKQLVTLNDKLKKIPELTSYPDLELVKEVVKMGRTALGQELFYSTPRMKDFAVRCFNYQWTTELMDKQMSYDHMYARSNFPSIVMPRGSGDPHCWPKAWLGVRDKFYKLLSEKQFDTLSRCAIQNRIINRTELCNFERVLYNLRWMSSRARNRLPKSARQPEAKNNPRAHEAHNFIYPPKKHCFRAACFPHNSRHLIFQSPMRLLHFLHSFVCLVKERKFRFELYVPAANVRAVS